MEGLTDQGPHGQIGFSRSKTNIAGEWLNIRVHHQISPYTYVCASTRQSYLKPGENLPCLSPQPGPY